MTKMLKLVTALAVLCLGSASASAGVINFDFTNDGLVTGLDDCGANCVLLKTAGIATATGDVNQSWLFQGAMKVYSGSPDLGWGVGSGLGWSFTDLIGNNLYGTFTGVGDILSLFGGSADLTYTVLGGSGIFNGAFGTGTSFVESVLRIFFHEEGEMTVYTAPQSVPEPGVTLLLLTALGIMGVMAYRRRRAQI